MNLPNSAVPTLDLISASRTRASEEVFDWGGACTLISTLAEGSTDWSVNTCI